MFLEILIILSFILTFFIIYNMLYNKKVKNYYSYIKEYKQYIFRLNDNKTIFLKRINSSVYIEYGIEKCLILNLNNNKFSFIDNKINKKINSINIFPFNLLNKFLSEKTFKKHEKLINNIIYYNGNLLDKKSYNLIMGIVEITTDLIKKNQEVENNKEIKDFDIDDILDKINKVGYDKLTIEEKQFLKNLNK